jgi:quercetin dioxygenase-like cupin family protein
MKTFSFDSVPGERYAGMTGVTIRWVIGKNVEAPHCYMRVIEIEPGHATGYHEHGWEHEVFVLDGEGVVRHGDTRLPLTPGTCAYVPPDEIHQFINTGKTVFRFICVIPKPEE